jgi:LacI family transcriptional regulator
VPKRTRRQSPAGIRQIAEALGVSIGTVDRALHNRPGINPETRARVLSVAQSLRYRPNLAARHLSSRKDMLIGVALPREIASFWNVVWDGIEGAFEAVERTGVRVLARRYERPGKGEVEAIAACLEEPLHGLLVAPSEPKHLEPLLARAHARGIPVVCVNSDAPGSARLATVSVDPHTSGALVGELLGRFLLGKGSVVLVTGLLATSTHAQKVEGFRRSIEGLWPALDLLAVVEAHDDEEEAYRRCREVLGAHPQVAGVYVATANSLPVLRALRDTGQLGRITAITTDLFPELVPHIESGAVVATIHQRPWTQGRVAFQVLHGFLAHAQAPPGPIVLSPQIVMKSNLALFLERLKAAGAGAREGRMGEPGIEIRPADHVH